MTFYLAAPTDENCVYPDTVGVHVDINGDGHDFFQATSPLDNVQWVKKTWRFKASHYWTILTFSSLDGTCPLGPVIDNVSVEPASHETSLYYITPREAENTGPVTFRIFCNHFSEYAQVRLEGPDGSTRAGYDIQLSDADGSGGYQTLEVTFDVTGATLGLWDIIATNNDGTEIQGQDLVSIFNGILLDSMAPATGGDIGYRTVIIKGSNFVPGMTLKLSKSGETDIPAQGVEVTSSETATAVFWLHGRAQGAWDVSAYQPGATEPASTLQNGFIVIPVQIPPKVGVTVNGPSEVRLQRYATYEIVFLNKGIADTVGVPIIQGIPHGATWEILSSPEPLYSIPDTMPERKKPFVFVNDLAPDNLTDVLLFPITNAPAGIPVTIVIRVLMENEGEDAIGATWDGFRF